MLCRLNIFKLRTYSTVKRIIIGLEEIGFQVLSIITNNNATNKIARSVFRHLPKLSNVHSLSVIDSRLLFFLFD